MSMTGEHDAFFPVNCLNVEAWLNQLFLDFPLLFCYIGVHVWINWSSKYLSTLFVANLIDFICPRVVRLGAKLD